VKGFTGKYEGGRTVSKEEKFDLGDQSKKIINTGSQEVAALKELVGMLNNPLITGAELPPEEKQTIPQVLPPKSSAIPPAKNVLVTANPRKASALGDRLFFTGRLGVGKDYCAAAAGYKAVGFADPIYALAEMLFGVQVNANAGKDLPGMREFLQAVGQWGRGTLTAQYPLTPARAVFVTMLRSMSASLPTLVDWSNFGRTDLLWIDSLLRRTENLDGKLAVTNVRFENEFKPLQEKGWQHWHIMSSPATWSARLASKNLTPASPQLKDISEGLGNFLDNDATQKISRQRNGEKLRIIWNDPDVPSPSTRFYSLAEFIDRAKAPVME
jgi:hypothetical protein